MKKSFLISILAILFVSITNVQNSQAKPLGVSAAGQFEPYVLYSSAGNAQTVGIGDFNNDGLNDAAVTNSAGELKVFLQNANGTLANPVSYTAGSRPESLAVGDLNHDNLDDIVTTNFSTNTISVFLQQANGTMASRTTYATGTGPDAVAVGDINGDLLDDIAVSNWNSNYISVFTQNLDGTFNAKVNYPSPQAGYDDIAIGDVSGDGLNDVVKMNGQGLNPNLSVFIQNSSGTLESAVSYSVGSVLGNGIGIGEVTGDGKLDVVMSYGGNTPTAYLAVFAQASNGTLLTADSYRAYDIPDPVAVSDINLDGQGDVVVAHSGWNRISAFPQEDNGSLGSYSLYPLPNFSASHYKPQGLVIGDVNQDQLPDVLLADYNYGLFVFLHSPVIPSDYNKSAPADDAQNQPHSLDLKWGTSLRTTSYSYCFDTTNDDQCDDGWISNGNNTSVTLSNLSPSTTYYWQVQAINTFGSTFANGGNWWSFTTHSPTKTKSFKSSGPNDGYVLESSETSNKGGSFNSTAYVFRLGDNSGRRQYRSILSFATGSGLPDNAVITKVTLKLKKQAIIGGKNPITLFKGLIVDIRKGYFGSDVGLTANDFQSPANKTIGSFSPVPANGWYTIELNAAKGNINKYSVGKGVTQIRLRFELDDNNNRPYRK